MAERAARGPVGEGRPRRRAPRWAWPRLLCRRFRRDADGVAAIEFALISVPFFALIFAILETALTFLTTQVLENAVEAAARQLYTGQFQQANESTAAGSLAGKFKTEFCKYFLGLTSCNDVKIDVQAYPNTGFPASIASPFTKNAAGETVLDPNFGAFNNPQGNQIVVVRAVVENPVFVSLLNPNQANLSNGKRLIVGTAAFRTEPFN